MFVDTESNDCVVFRAIQSRSPSRQTFHQRLPFPPLSHNSHASRQFIQRTMFGRQRQPPPCLRRSAWLCPRARGSNAWTEQNLFIILPMFLLLHSVSSHRRKRRLQLFCTLRHQTEIRYKTHTDNEAKEKWARGREADSSSHNKTHLTNRGRGTSVSEAGQRSKSQTHPWLEQHKWARSHSENVLEIIIYIYYIII